MPCQGGACYGSIRTDDDNLYPAPYHSSYGPSWGYGGTGPATLAALILRQIYLLDRLSITARSHPVPMTISCAGPMHSAPLMNPA